MKLYHTGREEIREPDIRRGRRNADFGQGFYLTPDREFARRWGSSAAASSPRRRPGGCVAAGRGFFHINSHGGAEPCPFSPYSDVNVRDTSLREAMNSGLFRALRDNGHLLEDHAGGCVLYEKRALVEQLLRESAGV